MSERWFKTYRMEWIAESLRVYGFINREHVMRKFGLSTPQASKDMNEFKKLHPDACEYNLSAKRFESRSHRERV